ncbi:MAG TPA: hypothetical protein VFL17_14880 [Anaerolineae bacterium]|nr:hypothetical protein [Anaerolineae bacterium]
MAKGESIERGNTIRFAWSAASGPVRATYRIDVLRYEPGGDRYVCRLVELVSVDRMQPDEAVSDDTLRSLTGKCVRVPREALNGSILPLKMTTLTGDLARSYFFDEA